MLKTFMPVVLLLLMLWSGVFMQSSEALTCYLCGHCDKPVAGQTCDTGDVCLTISNAAGRTTFGKLKHPMCC